jgi:cellulose synthase (UDP-forming)
MTWEDEILWVVIALGVPMTLLPWLSWEKVWVRRWCFRVICGIYWSYLAWRVTGTLPEGSLNWPYLYALVFLTLELIQAYCMYQFQSRLVFHSDRRDEADRNEGWYGDTPPRVDILITTYNEAWSIVEKTVVGALAQDYPNFRVWVCDDGRRPEFRRLAEEIGAGYITRNENLHAKAGNLNNALAHLRTLHEKPEFVAVLDADFVPLRRFVSRAATLLKDPKVGLVQTPQYHLNQDPLQAAFDVWQQWPDQQRYAFNVMLPAADARNAAYCCGTSFIARVEALTAIGDFPTEAVTEDMLTTIKMSMNGYRAVYLRERLTAGLAAEGMHEYVVQRGRWCLGSIQIGWWLTSLGNKSLLQRILTMEPFLRWGGWSLMRALTMMGPIVFAFTGVVPFYGSVADLLLLSFTLLVFERSFVAWLSRGAALPVIQHSYNLLNAFAVIPALFKGLFDRNDRRFRVTDKGTVTAGRVIYWGVLRWLLAYLVLSILGVLYGTGADGDLRPLFYVWTWLNCSTVTLAALACVEAPRRRTEYRYAADEPFRVNGRPGTILDLSLSGGRVRSSRLLRVGEDVSVSLRDVGDVSARVVRQAQDGEWGIAFSLDDEQRRALIRKLFCSDDYVKPAETGNGIDATFAVLRRFACTFGLARRRNPMVSSTPAGRPAAERQAA